MKKNINEKYLRQIIRETLINEINDFGLTVKGDLSVDDIKKGVPLYHRPKNGEGILRSLFTYGFSREFTNSNGGNMYGPGVYTVYSLKSSQKDATGYGSIIIKAYLLGGYQDFLIFNPDMAKQVYGNESKLEQQLLNYLPPKLAHDVIDNVNLYYTEGMKSSILAKRFCDRLGRKLDGTRVRGFVFTGGHDGDVCVVRDFSAVIPYSYSMDNGRTWKVGITDELVKRAGSSVDTFFKYENTRDENGEKIFDGVSGRAVNGFVMVHKNNKINFINVKTDQFISDIWFDFAKNFDEELHNIVEINGETYYISIIDNELWACDEDFDPMYKIE